MLRKDKNTEKFWKVVQLMIDQPKLRETVKEVQKSN